MRSIFAFMGVSILAAGAAFAQAGAVPPPPPASVTTPPALSGVPPTPAPATPGLPAPPASGATPSTTVSSVQAALSAGGFYRGPVDGVLSGPTRGAIRAFQVSARLPATGQLDGETAAALGVLTRAPASLPPARPFPESPIFIQP